MNRNSQLKKCVNLLSKMKGKGLANEDEAIERYTRLKNLKKVAIEAKDNMDRSLN